jgi:flagellar motor switch protein FliN
MEFSNVELSIIGEIGNVSVGGAASSLSDFVHKAVNISIPETKVLSFKEIKKILGDTPIYTKIDYKEGFRGTNLLMLKTEEARQFTEIILKEKLNMEFEEWDSFAENVLSEVFNIMAGNMSTAMSLVFNKNITIEPPQLYKNEEEEEMALFDDDDELVSVWFDVQVEDKLTLKLVNIVTVQQSQEMIWMIKGDHSL